MKEHVIEEWFHQYERDVTRFLVYYTGMIDVEDIVQETFLLAIKNLSRFRAESHPKTWLISIARNLVNDAFRRRKVWQRIQHLLTPKQPLSNELEERMVRNSEQLELHQAIHQLIPPYKEVVILRGILELSPLEVGDVLGWNQNKVNVTYHRALKKLKEQLEQEGNSIEGNKFNRRIT